MIDPLLSIGTASASSVESDLGCTSRIYFDNVTLALHNNTITSVIAAKQTVKNEVHVVVGFFSIKYRYRFFIEKCINFIILLIKLFG